jgi:dihydropteroate synthase
MNDLLPIKKTLSVGGKLISLNTPLVMGILNNTPDSFYDGGKYNGTIESVLAQATKHVEEGAAFLDVGGYSTRPSADEISETEELDRVLPVIEALKKNFPDTIISIDTFRASVARQAVKAGAQMVNDISGGDDDPDMFSTVAELRVPYILMHKKGSPKTMQADPQYEDVVTEVLEHLGRRLHLLRSLGVNDVIIDPGFGFGKTLEHNYRLLHNLRLFRMLGQPVLAGVSRKGMIHRLLKNTPEDALNGTTAAHVLALLQGVSLLRVHDVKEAMEAVKIINFYRDAN